MNNIFSYRSVMDKTLVILILISLIAGSYLAYKEESLFLGVILIATFFAVLYLEFDNKLTITPK